MAPSDDPTLTEVSEATPELKRGIALTAFLLMIMLVNPVIVLSYSIFVLPQVIVFPTRAPLWAVMATIILPVVNIVSARAIWIWKRWGLYSFTVSVILAFIVNLIARSRMGYDRIVIGLFGPVLMYFLLRVKWQYME